MSRLLEGEIALAGTPSVIAKVVSQAANSPNPKRRYAAPMHAKVFLFLRWLLPEWAWERLVASIVK